MTVMRSAPHVAGFGSGSLAGVVVMGDEVDKATTVDVVGRACVVELPDRPPDEHDATAVAARMSNADRLRFMPRSVGSYVRSPVDDAVLARGGKEEDGGMKPTRMVAAVLIAVVLGACSSSSKKSTTTTTSSTTSTTIAVTSTEAARVTTATTRAVVATTQTTVASVQTNVHPGAFCSPDGEQGTTSTGTPMTCSTTPSDSRDRWRAA